MNRFIETLGSGLIATAIVGGSLYGLARYAESGAPPAHPPPRGAPPPPRWPRAASSRHAPAVCPHGPALRPN